MPNPEDTVFLKDKTAEHKFDDPDVERVRRFVKSYIMDVAIYFTNFLMVAVKFLLKQYYNCFLIL